jgi:hypothetical protein
MKMKVMSTIVTDTRFWDFNVFNTDTSTGVLTTRVLCTDWALREEWRGLTRIKYYIWALVLTTLWSTARRRPRVRRSMILYVHYHSQNTCCKMMGPAVIVGLNYGSRPKRKRSFSRPPKKERRNWSTLRSPPPLSQNTVKLWNTIWTSCVSKLTSSVLNWWTITCMGHIKNQYQGWVGDKRISCSLGFCKTTQIQRTLHCLLWIKKSRAKDKTYIWVSMWWKTKNLMNDLLQAPFCCCCLLWNNKAKGEDCWAQNLFFCFVGRGPVEHKFHPHRKSRQLQGLK